MPDNVSIVDYTPERELEWLDIHASVMVDSAAWWTVIHEKPTYDHVVDLIALVDDRIVGFIIIEINAGIIEEMNPAGFVWEFGVHRDFRGKGIARAIIEEAHIRMNRDFSIDTSVWYSQDENAQKFYEYLGMEEIGRHWQFSIKADKALRKQLLDKGFNCWNLRGSCEIGQWEEVQKKFDIIKDDEAVSPRICVGYRYKK